MPFQVAFQGSAYFQIQKEVGIMSGYKNLFDVFSRVWMKSIVRMMIAAGVLVFFIAGVSSGEDKFIKMSTTTSTEASGLLDYLLPEFKKDTGITVQVMSKGTGAALRDGMDGNADVVFVHDAAREKKFVEEGYGTKRYDVMYNDFIIVGPGNDPAKIKNAPDAASAMKAIASAKAPFVSRGDDSGTHAREKQLWEASGILLTEGGSPKEAEGWYVSIGQGMGAALLMAEEKQGYVLSDRGTYLKYKFGRQEAYDLGIAYEGGDMLQNPYGVIPVNPKKFPDVNYDLTEDFAEWLVSERGQKLIGSYQLHGQPLFFPGAK
jgi:tungstate transport system substrate-binding protein